MSIVGGIGIVLLFVLAIYIQIKIIKYYDNKHKSNDVKEIK